VMSWSPWCKPSLVPVILALAGAMRWAQGATIEEAVPQPRDCPSGIPAAIHCLGGRDSAGAFYLIAVPKEWNGILVVHSHGGPFLGAPTMKRTEQDLQRWSIEPRAGYAWAASSYHQGGVAVHSAAQDTERVRQIAVKLLKPKLTILHGQSWGASVAAITAETYTDGKPYDGVMLSSGVLAGGSRAYDVRLDLRVVYEYLCHNHPRPDEAQYPLWMGLPAGVHMKEAEIKARVNECLAVDKPEAQRTPEQARKLRELLAVLKMPERTLQSHMNWATLHFQDIATQRTGGADVFGNIGAQYQGSDDDQALNAGVARYAADPAAVARFAADTDPTGQIPVPVLTVHAIDDPIAFVEMEHTFADTMARAGHADTLVQVFSEDHDHSYISDATYVATLNALMQWIREGKKPTPESVAAGCMAAQTQFKSTCHIRPEYHPAALDSRVTPRQH